MPRDARDGHGGRRNGYAGDDVNMPYSNPQNAGESNEFRQAASPRRAGEGQIYRDYVPAPGETPAKLRMGYDQPGQASGTDGGSRRLGKARIAAIAVAVAVALGAAGVIGARVMSGGDSHAQDEQAVLEDREHSFYDAGETAVEVLTANKAATDEDMAALSSLFPSLNDEYEQISEDTPSAVSPDDIAAKVSVSGWKDKLTGWDDLQLRVRAAEYASEELGRKYGGTYEATTAKVSDEGGPQSVTLSCRCTDGKSEGLSLTATVSLTGRVPTVADDMDSAVSYREGVLQRLESVLAAKGGLYIGDFALEGYTLPMRTESGQTLRTETWWLYVNSNVAPQDTGEFVKFVNDMHLAFTQTAGKDVANIDLTVISCDANDPAMEGRTFSDLAAEIAFSDDPGGLYMEFDYVLRGQATSTTPCMEGDLDGRLHPYTWEQSAQI